MSYVIFGDAFTFPEGDASTNRVHTYAKGLRENGQVVHVVCFRNDYKSDFSGETEHIKYYHPYHQSKRSGSFFIRRWQKFRKYLRAYNLACTINKKERIAVIHCYSKTIATHAYAFALSRYFGSKLILERSEHPFKSYNTALSLAIGKIRVSLEIRLCDGMFCISEYLRNFYHARGADSTKLFLVPSIVDAERFKGHYDPPLNYKYIAYCGSLTVLKDGVNILIKSFARLYREYPDIYLLLIGEADTLEEEMELKELVKTSKIESQRVIFLGKLPRTAIPAYLCNAEILALARPRSIVSDAGFPSKLTEYLATGKPVVVTKVGEIPDYLKDNENAFLSEPDSVDAFSERLDFVLRNYETAKEVGANGRELTSTVFNYRFQTKRIINFIGTL